MVDDGEVEPGSLESIISKVELVRGIRAEGPIDARVIAPSEIPALIERAVVGQREPEVIERYQTGLVTVGLWPPDRTLIDEYARVMGEEVAGLYLPADRVLYVVSDVPAPFGVTLASLLLQRDLMVEFALSHELVHLLQHQRYPALFGDDDFYLVQDDAALAAQSSFEGDATYFGLLAMDLPPPSQESFDASFESELANSGGALRRAPALIRGLIGFPYTGGYPLALSEGADLLDDPPASTEQVLHPERRREPFWVFDLAAVGDALPEGCDLVMENNVGELQLSILLNEHSSEAVDPAAWVGWNGDRYIAARCESGPALFWLTSWDSGADAAEFMSAYLEVAPAIALRAGFEQPLLVHRLGREVVVASETLAPLESLIDGEVSRTRVRTLAELRSFAAGGNF